MTLQIARINGIQEPCTICKGKIGTVYIVECCGTIEQPVINGPISLCENHAKALIGGKGAGFKALTKHKFEWEDEQIKTQLQILLK